jgi:hypothetical protein
MKKTLALILFVCVTHTICAQMPKHLGNFSLFQQYYNPALTAYDYSAVKLLYRNQWTGFENAPQTILLSAELDPSDLRLLKAKNVHVADTMRTGSELATTALAFYTGMIHSDLFQNRSLI